jgi:hypothetical protein
MTAPNVPAASTIGPTTGGHDPASSLLRGKPMARRRNSVSRMVVDTLTRDIADTIQVVAPPRGGEVGKNLSGSALLCRAYYHSSGDTRAEPITSRAVAGHLANQIKLRVLLTTHMPIDPHPGEETAAEIREHR